ncbi:MAG: CotH kinase family protein [Clostridia bacterium]|nr:CotH kinase family protein [Clostridia bacterium]
MKKSISFILSAIMLLCVFAVPLSVTAEDIMTPYDVPKILFYTEDGVTPPSDKTKINTEVYIIDEEGGQYETIHVPLEADEDGKYTTVNVRGNSTSAAHKKAYNFKFTSKIDVLGMGKNKKWSLLANAYEKTLLRNKTVLDVAPQIGVPYTPDYKVVDVYMNDVLLGSYLLVDSVEVGSTRVDIDVDNNEYLLELDYNTPDEDCYYFYSGVYNVKFAINEPEIEDLTEDQKTYVEDLLTKAEQALQTGRISEIEKYFDLDSMSSFYLVLEFFKNVDVNTSSTRFHIKGGKIYGGPVWDFDLSSGNYREDYYTSLYDSNGNSYKGLWATTMPWFGALTNVSSFQNTVEEKFLEYQDIFVNLYADNINGQNHIDETIDTYGESYARNYNEAGWKFAIETDGFVLERTPLPTYEANVEYYREWLKNRNEWLLEEWGLDNTTVTMNSNSTFVQDGYLIKGAEAGMKVSSLLANFSSGTSLMKDGVALATTANIPNGAVITKGGASYAVIVKGDVDGNGELATNDYIMVKRACMDNLALDGIDNLAADVDDDEEFGLFDYLLLKRHVMGTYDIYGD